MLKIQNITKSYEKGKPVIEDISLTVSPGDIYGFIGHNGAGKTTTIKCITGILEFEQGSVTINGVSLKDDPITCKKNIAYLPDNPDLYESLSGIRYLNFVADLFEIDPGVRKERIESLAREFDILGNLGNKISSYSHGTKQKLAIISALIHEPKLLVLDEPFVGLDPKAAFTLKQSLKHLCEKGSAVFFSTHILEVAEKICNKIAIIKKGKIVVSGDTKQVVGDESLEEIFLELVEHA